MVVQSINITLLQNKGKLIGKIRRNFSDEEFKKIKDVTAWIKDESRKSIRERVYCLLNNVKSIPKCPVCFNNNKFLKNGTYSKTCSKSCGIANSETQKRIKSTKLDRYGSENYVNSEKAKCTMLKKYNVAHTSKLIDNRNKAKLTSLMLHGSENYNNREKAKRTSLYRYGVDNPSKSYIIKNIISVKIADAFNARKSANGVLYIIEFTDYNLIKIGVTANLENRLKQLTKEFGNSNVICTVKSRNIYVLERHLHNKYKDFRVCLSKGSGRTEFFDISPSKIALA